MRDRLREEALRSYRRVGGKLIHNPAEVRKWFHHPRHHYDPTDDSELRDVHRSVAARIAGDRLAVYFWVEHAATQLRRKRPDLGPEMCLRVARCAHRWLEKTGGIHALRDDVERGLSDEEIKKIREDKLKVSE